MKRSKLITIFIFLVLIPMTVILGTHLPGRAYYITGSLIIAELMIPFFLSFEEKKPQARELVLIAVLCALAIASRVVIQIPHFKPIYAVIIIAAISFGPETGFLVGAVSALGSNFFFGQGAYTPWQMLAYGAAGLLTGFASRKKWLKRRPVPIALLGGLSVLLCVGPILDTCSLFLYQSRLTAAGAAAIYLAGLPINIRQALSTFLALLLLGEPLLKRLDRIKLRYGIVD